MAGSTFVSRNEELSCGVVILAGGQSRRMGSDKARLRIGRRTLLGHVRRVALQIKLPMRQITRDSQPGLGPLGGILTALESSRHDAELFLACDMPFVSAHLLKRVIGAWRAKPRPVFMKAAGRVGFPFLVPVDSVETVRRFIDQGHRSLHSLADLLAGARIEPAIARPHELFNVNTPDALVEARRRWRQDVAPTRKAEDRLKRTP